MKVILYSFIFLSFIVNSQGNNDIVLIDLDTTGGVFKTSNAINITNREGYDNQPSFSANGSSLLYSSIHEGVESDIYSYNIETAEHLQITKTKEAEYSPIYMDNDFFSVVRVDKDSLQRLYKYNMKGKVKDLIINHQDSIGYYTWLGEKELAIFVLPEPFELRIVRTDTNLTKVVTENIGTCLHKHPKTGKTLFVTEFDPGQWFICEITDVDAENFKIDPIVNTINGGKNFSISSNGDYFVIDGPKVYKFNPEVDEGWSRIYDGSKDGYTEFYRLAISPTLNKIALVTK